MEVIYKAIKNKVYQMSAYGEVERRGEKGNERMGRREEEFRIRSLEKKNMWCPKADRDGMSKEGIKKHEI